MKVKAILLVLVGLVTISTATAAHARLKAKVRVENQAVSAEVKAELKSQNKEEKVARMKERLNKVIDRVTERYQSIIKKVEGKKRLSNETKQSVKGYLETQIGELNALKTEVDNATTPQQLKEILKNIREDRKKVREDVVTLVRDAMINRFDKIVIKVKERLNTLKAKVTEAKANGKDTSKAENLLSHCEADIERAEGHKAKNVRAAVQNLKHCYHDFRMVRAELN